MDGKFFAQRRRLSPSCRHDTIFGFGVAQWLHYALTLVAVCLVCSVYLPGVPQRVGIVGVALLWLTLLIGTPIQDFYMLLAISVCTTSVEYSMLLIAACAVKLVVFHFKGKKRAAALASVAVLLIAELALEIGWVAYGNIAIICALIAYFGMFIAFEEGRYAEIKKVMAYLFAAILIALTVTLIVSLDGITDISMDNRFGQKVIPLGGAMDIPRYCAIMFSLWGGYLLTHRCGWKTCVAALLTMFYVFVLGMLTLSKAFYLGMAVIAFLFFLAFMIYGRSWKERVAVIAVCLGLVAAALIIPQTREIIRSFIERIQASDDISTGRFDIFKDVFAYMGQHPYTILFGIGKYRYILTGAALDRPMQQGAHNLFIDGFASWGLLGAAVLIILGVTLYRTQKKYFGGRRTLMHWIPLICMCVQFMSGGVFHVLKDVAYLVAAILAIGMLGNDNLAPLPERSEWRKKAEKRFGTDTV